ncbi:MAG: hypothetical protein KKD28_14245 [Chloroflexi bacterium]|nr:hypothetical protein [Chloroflexota bacterium]
MKTVIAGALGECVHVAGVSNFLRLAEQAGWQTIFLGPAVSVQEFLDDVRPLANADFHIWRQTRTGLLSYPVDSDTARAHLSASEYLQMALRPHVVHVVGYTEADHAATAADVIEILQTSTPGYQERNRTA